MNKDSKMDLIKDAIREYQQEEMKHRKQTVYHNTELLMKHYNELRQHSENAIYKASQILQASQEGVESIDNDIEEEGDLFIGAILKSKVRTAIMVQHIEIALSALKYNSINNCCDNEYNAFEDIYLRRIPYNELAIKYNCSEMTVRRWKNKMLNELSILLFGEGGLILGV